MTPGRKPLRGALLCLAFLRAPAAATDAVQGKTVYVVRCAPCHGAEGRGDGPAAAAIDPKPRNFRDPGFWKGRTTDHLRQAVRQGRPGTLMAPFEGELTATEIDDVVAHLQSFRPTAP